jgi:hypothetical protein
MKFGTQTKTGMLRSKIRKLVEYRCKKIYFCAFGKKQQILTVKTAKPFKLSCYRPSNPKTVEITKGREGNGR